MFKYILCLQLSTQCNIVVKIIQDQVFSQAQSIRNCLKTNKKGNTVCYMHTMGRLTAAGQR